MSTDNIFDLLDSTDIPVEKTVLEKLEEKEQENPIEEKKEEVSSTPVQEWSVPSVFDKEVVEQAVKDKKADDAVKVQKWLAALLENEMNAYREQHGYNMSGQIKRATRKRIERLYKKGRIKPMFDFKSFN